MKCFSTSLLILTFMVSAFAQKSYNYPEAPKDASSDTYFNETIEDPYQWMENSNDSRLEEWLKLQRKLTTREEKKYVNVWTLRNQIATMYHGNRSEQKATYKEEEEADSLKSKYEFTYRRSSTSRFPDFLYRLKGRKNYKKLVHIKELQKDSDDNIIITGRTVNEDHDLVAIEFSRNGSDWREVYIYNLLTGERLPNGLKNLRGGSNLIWEGKDLVYEAYDEPRKGRELLDIAKGQKLVYHKLGNSQAEDNVLYKNPDTTGASYFTCFKVKEQLFFNHYMKVRNKTYRALSTVNLTPETFYLSQFLLYPNSEDIDLGVEAVFGNTVILNTNWEAKNGRVLAADISKLNQVSELVPEYDILLTNVNKLGKDKIACIYEDQGQNIVLIFDLKGELLRKIDFPKGKKLNAFYENSDAAEYTDFCVSSFYHPNIWYQLSLTDFTFKPSSTISVPYKAETLETRYVNYLSKDGTEIPMYITCLKSTNLDGNNPTLLYGYGGYGTTVTPRFDESLTLWLLHGGIIAVPNVRGGGAKGSEWANAGRRLNKQTAIDDFIAAAEYLTIEKYTNPNKLAINGVSHGGLLVGAALTQRPELFKAAIAEVGVYDMLRFEKFTVGSMVGNNNEFGNTQVQGDFENLKSYSPLHNIKKGVKYPNLLLITGTQDDRVPPLHSYKFLATLQEKGSNEGLYTMFVLDGSGHGGALNSDDFAKKILCKYSFLFGQLDVNLN